MFVPKTSHQQVASTSDISNRTTAILTGYVKHLWCQHGQMFLILVLPKEIYLLPNRRELIWL